MSHGTDFRFRFLATPIGVEEDPMSLLAYHPERIDELWRQTRHAVDELTTIVSDDSAAAAAMRAVRLAHAHRVGDWLPLLERIRSNTALIAPIVAGFTVEEPGVLPRLRQRGRRVRRR
jgi:hypothetical protein